MDEIINNIIEIDKQAKSIFNEANNRNDNFDELVEDAKEKQKKIIDKEIEELSEILLEEEEKANEKSVIAQVTFVYSSKTLQRIKKLQRRIMLYQLIFGEIK